MQAAGYKGSLAFLAWQTADTNCYLSLLAVSDKEVASSSLWRLSYCSLSSSPQVLHCLPDVRCLAMLFVTFPYAIMRKDALASTSQGVHKQSVL